MRPPATGRRSPLLAGYLVALGAGGALLTGAVIYGLRSILLSVFVALFATVGLDPLVRWFQRRGMRRAPAILTVILLIVAVAVTIILIVAPVIARQVSQITATVPAQLDALTSSGGMLGSAAASLDDAVHDPKTWAAIGSGVLGFGAALVDGVTSAFFVAILTIYFVASYDTTKRAGYRLVARSHRATFIGYSERILANFGKYLSGMVTLAFFNAVFSTLLLAVCGVPSAFLIGIVAFFVTMIPLVGTVITTAGMTVLALLHSPVSGVAVLIAMLVYMQVEAYILTPKVMGKAVQIPGSVVLIAALAGSTLFGLAGALVAIPISAGVILIVTEIVMPRQEQR